MVPVFSLQKYITWEFGRFIYLFMSIIDVLINCKLFYSSFPWTYRRIYTYFSSLKKSSLIFLIVCRYISFFKNIYYSLQKLNDQPRTK